MKSSLLLVCSAFCLSPINGHYPGPNVQPTKGEIWPKPQVQSTPDSPSLFVIDPKKFTFKLDKYSSVCDIIQKAVGRYMKRLFVSGDGVEYSPNSILGMDISGNLQGVEIVMNNNRGCESQPHEQMDEHYEIKIDSPDEPGRARIISFSVWGILRGLESFSQLVYYDEKSRMYAVNSTSLMDFPRFSHRGVMLDSSRHFLAMRVILANLDLMEMNKMNVFHWHLTDDPSFPYESTTFPNLSAKGAFRSSHVYTQNDIAAIIEEARIRGIRVVAEFDTPGHSQSWEPGQPGLLTKCSGPKLAPYGPINPTIESVYTFLTDFFAEVTKVFPDKLVHLGGDEVDTRCWESNKDVVSFMNAHNMSGHPELLESYYLGRLFKIIEAYPTNTSYAVWEEVFENDPKLNKDRSIVHVWKGNWQKTVEEATKAGLRVLLSSPWYLNEINYGIDWPKYYGVEPQDFGGNSLQKRLVLGGEACMWGEYVNTINMLPRLWPRASAVAERLWSSEDTKNATLAAGRLQEHECRMLTRGYPVEPSNGPGFCNVDWISY